MKKKVCLFEQHFNHIKQSSAKGNYPFLNSNTCKFTSGSSLKKTLSPYSKHVSSFSPNTSIIIPNSKLKQIKQKAKLIPKERKQNLSGDKYLITDYRDTVESRPVRSINFNNPISKSIDREKDYIERLKSKYKSIKISPIKPIKIKSNFTSKSKVSGARAFEKTVSNYIANSTKVLEKFRANQLKKKEIDERENAAEQSNLSIMTESSNGSSGRIRSRPRIKQFRVRGSKSLQAEIDLLFGKKPLIVKETKKNCEPEEDNKNRSSLLNKINKAVNKSINIFTKLNLFEEAETEEFDNPEHRDYMEDVVLCEYITTKLVSSSRTNNDKSPEVLTEKNQYIPKDFRNSSSNCLENSQAVEHTDVDQLAESLIENSMYGNQQKAIKTNQFKDYVSKKSSGKPNSSGTTIPSNNLLIDNTNSVTSAKLTLFAIFDGHGGNQVSTKAKEILPKEIHSRLNMSSSETIVKSVIIDCFEKIDKELMTKIPSCDDVGSTCTLCFINKNKTNRIINIANLGDSHSYLISNKKAIRLTQEHKCDNEEEISRLKEKNAIIFQNRMFGQLALTRAFCDRKHKPYGLSAIPSVNSVIIKEKPILHNATENSEVEYDLYLVLASDGVWDVTSDSDLQKIFVENNKGKTTKQLAKQLIDYAIDKGSTDNISLIVIKL